jgi:hypothetical protein
MWMVQSVKKRIEWSRILTGIRKAMPRKVKE